MNNKDVHIRNASVNDAESLCKIYNYYIQNTIITFDTELKTTDEFKDEMISLLDKFPFLVIEYEYKIIGYANATPWKSRCAYEHSVETSIYLSPEEHNKGFGSKLYSELINTLRKSDVHTIIAGISLPNEVSIKVHENLGFKKIALFEEVGFKFECWIDVGYWQLLI